MKTYIAYALLAIMVIGVKPALAETRTGNQEHQYDLPCVQSAVATREAAIQKAFTTYANSITLALTNRASALNTAWGITDGPQRRAARKSAWETYRSANQSARTTMKSSKKAAWETFRTASKNCKVPVAETEENDMI